MITYGTNFWRKSIDRAIKTSAQGVLGIWGVADGLFNWWNVDVHQIVGIAIGGFVLSIVTSIATAHIGEENDPSVL